MLTRTASCQLARLDPEGLKSLVRRDQLPFNARSPDRKRDTYSPFEAFLCILADDLTSGGERSLAVAMRMVSVLAPALAENWPAIAETGRRLAYRVAVQEEVLCARGFRATYASDEAADLLICGTASVVFGALNAHQPLASAKVGNASRAASTLFSRAWTFDIPLPTDPAGGTPDYTPFWTPSSDKAEG